MFDNDNSRQISKTYTVNTADTWEHKTVTFEGDTPGAYAADNGNSMQISWWLLSGSNTAGGTLSTTWTSNTQANRAVGQVNVLDSTSNEWYITGVQLEVGEQATPFEHRSFGDELARCQRDYYQAGGDALNSFAYKGYLEASQFVSATHQHPVTMRASPTLTKVGTFNVTGVAQPTAVAATTVSYVWQAQKDGSAGTYGFFSNSSGGFTLDAEL